MKSNTLIPRTLIIVLQVFGTVFSVIGLSTYIAYMGTISDSISSNQVEAKMLTAMILSILVYLTWKSIYACVVIIQFMKMSSDLEISNNRFVLSALSLNLGGFVTPFILTSLPNIDVQSTLNPRYVLSKILGVTSLVGGSLALMTMFASVSTGNGALSSAEMFDPTTSAGAIGITQLTLCLAIIVFGAITTGLFYGSKKVQVFLETSNGDYGTALKVIGSIWMAVVSVELCLTMCFAVVRLIGIVVDFFETMRNKQGFMGIFYTMLSFANIFLTFLYTVWIIEMTVNTITGLWSKNGIQYKEYSELKKHTKQATK